MLRKLLFQLLAPSFHLKLMCVPFLPTEALVDHDSLLRFDIKVGKMKVSARRLIRIECQANIGIEKNDLSSLAQGLAIELGVCPKNSTALNRCQIPIIASDQAMKDIEEIFVTGSELLRLFQVLRLPAVARMIGFAVVPAPDDTE